MRDRSRRQPTVILLVSAFLLAGAFAAHSQDEEGPTPLLEMAEITVEPDRVFQYRADATPVFEALRRTEDLPGFAAYGNVTGGEPVFRVFTPARSMAEMDSWTSTYEAVLSAHGVEKANQILERLSEISRSSTELLAYEPDLSTFAAE